MFARFRVLFATVLVFSLFAAVIPAAAAEEEPAASPVPVPEPEVAVSDPDAVIGLPDGAVVTEAGPMFRAWRMPDGTLHREMFTGPVFFEKAPGVWVPTDVELRLDSGADEYVPRRAGADAAAFASALVPGEPVARVAGMAVSYPDATAPVGTPTIEDRSITYAGALSSGRDLRLTSAVGGFEEAVVLHDAEAPGAHRTRFDVPADVTARQEGPGVEFIDAAGTVIGRFGGGLAWDSADVPAETPVLVTLISSGDGAVVTETSVDPAWLSAQRVYPVTIDPTFTGMADDTCSTSPSTYSGCDTYVNSDNLDGNSGVGYWTNSEMRLGSSGAYQEGSTSTLSDGRLFVKFPTDSMGSGNLTHTVSAATLTLNAYDARGATSCSIFIAFASASSPTKNTVWNNQPSDGLKDVEFCSLTGEWSINVRDNVNRWFSGSATNHGFKIRPYTARSTAAFRQLRSWNSGYSTAPRLSVTYDAKAPTAPRNVSASAGDANASVSWTTPDYDGASAITGYVVEWWNSSGRIGSTTLGSSARSHTVTGLPNGTGVYFRVMARNSIGDSTAAVSSTVVPKGRPGAPTSVTATAGPQSATLNWSAPASDGGSAITGYYIETRRSLDNVVVQSTTAAGSARSHTSTGLANGTPVYFTILARNAYGDSASVQSNTVTPTSPPGSPQNVQATAGDQSAKVTWAVPTSDGGSPITSYTLELRHVANNGLYSSDTVSSIMREHTKTGLVNGTEYYFMVLANSANGSSPGTRSNNVRPAPAPAQHPQIPILVYPVTAYTFPAEEVPQEFRVETSDPQADRYQAEVHLRAANGASVTSAVVMSVADSGTQSEGSAFPPLLEGRYEWRARACDVTEARNCSEYTAWRAFQVGPALRPSSGSTLVGLEDFYGYEQWDTGSGSAYVNSANGNLVVKETDLSVPGPLNLRLTRTYNLMRDGASGPLGRGWTLGIAEGEGMADALLEAVLSLDLDRMVRVVGNEDMFEIFDADGTTHHFAKGGVAAQGWQSPPGVNLTLSDGLKGTSRWYHATRPDGVRYEFELVDNVYRLVRIADRVGNALTLSYSGGKLMSITDGGARTLTFTWTGNHVTLARYSAAGLTQDVAYTVDATADRLTGVTLAAGTTEARTRSYAYGTEALTSVTDGRGNTTRFAAAGGRLTGVTDRAGKVWTVGYDPTCGTEVPGRTQMCVTNPTGGIRTWTVNATTANPTAFTDEGDVDEAGNARRNARTFVYSANRLQREIDEVGNVTDHEYNELGQVSRRQFSGVGEAPEISEFQYYVDKGAGDLTEARTGVGSQEPRTLRFSYDPAKTGLLTTQVDPLGNATTFGYYANGRLKTVTNALNNVTTYGDTSLPDGGYHFSGQPTRIVDATGKVTRFAYDFMGRQTEKVDRLGSAWTQSWDRHGNVRSSTDPLGNVTRYCHDANDNKVSEIRPKAASTVTCAQDGATPYVTSWTYDARDLMIGTKANSDGQLRMEAHIYDNAGRLVLTQGPRSFDPVTGVLLPLQQRTTQVLYPNGRVRSITDPEGNVTDVVYTANGHPRRVTEPGAGAARRSTVTTFNGRGQQTSVLMSGHAKPTRYEYNVHGQLSRQITPMGRVTTTAYDRAGREVTVTDPEGSIVDRTYDAVGNLRSVSQPTGDGQRLRTNYEYSPRNELVLETDPSDVSHTVEYAYDAEGRQTLREDRTHGVWTRRFVSTLRPDGLVSETVSEVPNTMAGRHRTVRGYDANGNEVSVQTFLDGAGTPNVSDVSAAYTSADEPKTWTETLFGPSGTGVSKVTTYAYERDGALSARTVDGQTTSYTHLRNGHERTTMPWGGAPVVTSSHTPDGMLASRAVGVVFSTAYTYDLAGRVSSKIAQTPAGVSLSAWQQVVYDEDDYRTGEVASQRQPAGTILSGPATYSYDAAGRLTSGKHPYEPAPEAYVLDDAGNIVADDTHTYSYDANRLELMESTTEGTSIEFEYGLTGDMTSQQQTAQAPRTFTYDAASHPRRTTEPDGSWVEYAYDGMERMVRRVDSDGSVELLFHDGSSQTLSLETDASGAVATRYLLNSGGEPLAQHQASTGWGWYVTDLRDNLTQLLDGTGSIKAVYGYDPFGQLEPALTNASSGWGSRLGYQMAPRDAKTGTYNLGPRLYDPVINRFVGADFYVASASNVALALDPLTGNRYMYAGANPVGFVDDGHGLIPFLVWLLRAAAGWYGEQAREKAWREYKRAKGAMTVCPRHYRNMGFRCSSYR